jgi:pimeloyl-ACP methyl ester carboxylesterase
LLPIAVALAACVPASPQREPPVRLGRATVNGAELAYVEQGSGETVVFLNGTATDYRVFDELRGRFDRDFRFVAYSRRHDAPNTWPDAGDTYALKQHAEDLVALIRTLGVDRAHVVAVSMGARVAAHAAVHHPQVMQTLTLSDGLLAPPLDDEGRLAMAALASAFESMLGRARAGNDRAAVETYVDIAASEDGGWKGLSARQRLHR